MDAEILLAAVTRVEQKLDLLLAALMEDDEPEPESWPTLDGESLGGPRDPGTPL